MPSQNTPINNASIDELEAELAKRKAAIAGPPEPLPNPDYSALRQTVIDGVKTAASQKYMDEDFQHYVLEAAIKAVYGAAYWEWRRKQSW